MWEFFRQLKASFTLAALLYIILGLVLLIWPGSSVVLLCRVLGVMLLLYALITIISYFVHDSGTGAFKVELLLGVLAAALALLLLLQPAFIMSIIPVILGLYIVTDSLVNLRRCAALYRVEYPRWWVHLLLSLLGVGLGALVLLRPFQAAEAAFMLTGAAFLYTGLADLWTMFQVSRATRELRKRIPIEIDPIE